MVFYLPPKWRKTHFQEFKFQNFLAERATQLPQEGHASGAFEWAFSPKYPPIKCTFQFLGEIQLCFHMHSLQRTSLIVLGYICFNSSYDDPQHLVVLPGIPIFQAQRGRQTRCGATCYAVHSYTASLQALSNGRDWLGVQHWLLTSLKALLLWLPCRQLFPGHLFSKLKLFPPQALPLLTTLHQMSIPSLAFTLLCLVHNHIPFLIGAFLTKGFVYQ